MDAACGKCAVGSAWPSFSGTIAAVGLLAGWLATRSALRAPIVPALRGD